MSIVDAVRVRPELEIFYLEEVAALYEFVFFGPLRPALLGLRTESIFPFLRHLADRV